MKANVMTLLCVALLCGAQFLDAQTPQWQWAAGAGGVDLDYGYSTAVDSQGNQYLTGSFESTATFGPHTLSSSGNIDIYAAKLDPYGNWLWAVKAGGAASNEGLAIAVDSAGNAYLTGNFAGTATFGTHTLTASGNKDVFAAKLDTAGNWLWAVKAGGSGNDNGNAIAVDSAGNSYLTGVFRDTATFGSHTLSSSGLHDIFAAKLSPAGSFLWAVKAGGADSDYALGVAVDSAGNSHLTGKFFGTAFFGTHTLVSTAYDDVFAAKLDPAGNWLWAAQGGVGSSEVNMGIAVDGAGNAYLAGCFYGTATFGTHTISSDGIDDIYAAKLDPAGNWLWAVKAGGVSYDYAYGVAVDSAGNAYLTGSFEETATFGPHTLSSGGSGDIFAAKLGPTGNWLWAVKAGGESFAVGLGIAVNDSGTAWLTGYYYGDANFGAHGISSYGSYDIFAAKLVFNTPVDDGLAPETNTQSRLYDAWPNPFRRGESALIKTDVASGETGILRVFNLRGQLVAHHELGPGTHEIRLDSQNLPAGIYLYNLQTGNHRETKKLVLLK